MAIEKRVLACLCVQNAHCRELTSQAVIWNANAPQVVEVSQLRGKGSCTKQYSSMLVKLYNSNMFQVRRHNLPSIYINALAGQEVQPFGAR